MRKHVLFDLDGTLLPMEQETFVGTYFKELAKMLAPYGYTDTKKFIDSIWAGVGAMVKNDGSGTNEEAFWKKFSSIYGDKVYDDVPVFEEFYATKFNLAEEVCGKDPKANETVKLCKELGYDVILATNPLFPMIAQENRIRWAMLDKSDFSYITSYENSRYCKPNPKYFTMITEELDIDPAECLMVGNDASEDLVAETVGMEVFLLTDHMINKEDKDLSGVRHGGFEELQALLGEK